MPFVNITITKPLAREQKQHLIRRTSDAVMEALATPLPSVRILLNELPQGHYFCGGSFDVAAVLFDIDMIAGRTDEAKARLIADLNTVAHETTGVSEDEIRVRVTDFSNTCFGMAGGITAKAAGR